MAPSDPEKLPILSVEDDGDVKPPRPRAPSRRVLLWIPISITILLVFSIRLTYGFCPAATAPLKGYWVFRAGETRPESTAQAIISRSPTLKVHEVATSSSSAAAPARTVLKTFEVAQPVLMPDGPAESDGSTRSGNEYRPELCTVLLMRHDFAWSYGKPFVGNYTPPQCEFDRVVLNFSVVSQGRQFDRLAIMFFGDTEVWRTSTAEPTPSPGISWIYLKDMTEYLYLWKSPQKIIFDLRNLINDKYTGIFNTTMTAIFYSTGVQTDQAPPSDLIIPVSARQGANNSVSQFVLPAQNATNTITLPRNVRRAVFSVSANGQASEEFWWSNVLQNDVYTFNATAGELPGLSPFREVQVLIDGHLAGAQWPFPVIFTGGVVPSLHRPVVGIHAFDLREHEIDITPFVPLLCDGAHHTFTIRVAGLNTTSNSTAASLTETVNESWYVTGKIFLWMDSSTTITDAVGKPPTIHHSPPTISLSRSVTTAANGTNETLTYTTSVQRTLRITSGSTTWSQSLSYVNRGRVSAFGYDQLNDLVISGSDTSSFSSSSSYTHSISPNHSPTNPQSNTYYHTTYRYPLFSNSSYSVSPQGNLSIWAHLKQGKEVSIRGASVHATGLEAFMWYSGKGYTVRLRTSKEGEAGFTQSGNGSASSGWGGARQVFWFGVDTGADGAHGAGTELYFRDVSAVNGTVVQDTRRMEGREEVSESGGGGDGGGGSKGKEVASYGEW
ncbi:hypothetical protein VTI74DRAFT_4571 [Chaetomium olivicolor]